MRVNPRRLPALTAQEKEYASSLNLEWLKLSNKILRSVPGSPTQKKLQAKLAIIPQYKIPEAS